MQSKTIARALTKAWPFCKKSKWQNIRLTVQDEALTITATNLDQQIGLTVQGVRCADMDVSLDVHAFKAALGLADDFTLTPQGSGAVVNGVTIQGKPIGDFPAFDPFEPSATLEANGFCDALATVRLAISTEETRYYLNGAHINPRGEVVSTDGYRLIKTPWENAKSLTSGAIVPRAVCDWLIHNPCDRLGFSDRHAFFEGPDYILKTKLIDDSFPDYTRVIPDALDCGPSITGIDAKACAAILAPLLKAAKSKDNKQPYVRIDQSGATVNVNGNPILRAMPWVMSEDFKPVAFNLSYLLDVLTLKPGAILQSKIGKKPECAPYLINAGATVAVLMPIQR